MAVKAVEMVRKIRDQLYEEMKDLSLEEQKELVERESRALQRMLQEKGWLKKPKRLSKPSRAKKVKREVSGRKNFKRREQRISR